MKIKSLTWGGVKLMVAIMKGQAVGVIGAILAIGLSALSTEKIAVMVCHNLK